MLPTFELPTEKVVANMLATEESLCVWRASDVAFAVGSSNTRTATGQSVQIIAAHSLLVLQTGCRVTLQMFFLRGMAIFFKSLQFTSSIPLLPDA